MPTPQKITSTVTHLPVWEADDFGNTMQDKGVMLKANASPTPTPDGYLQLYSPDGEQLWTVDDAGNASAAVIGPSGGTVVVVPSAANQAAAGTAINNAIASLGANGGTVVIPAGTWTLDTAILIDRNGIILKGISNLASLIRFTPASVPTAIKMIDTTQRFCEIDTLRIESNTAGSGTAIDASYFVNSVLSNLRIGATGVTPNVGVSFNAIGTYYNVIRDSRIAVSGASSIGIRLDNTANSNMVQNVRILGDASTTGVLVNAHANRIDRIDVETLMAIGIDVGANGNDCVVTAPYIEAISTGIRLASAVEAFVCLGGFIVDCTTANLTDNGAQDPAFLNVRLQYESYTLYTARSDVFPASYPMQTGTDQPQDHNYIAWTGPLDALTTGTVVTNGTIYLSKVQVRYRVSVSKILWWVSAVAVTPTASQNWVGVYNSSGAQVIAPVGVDAATTSTGNKETAVTPTVLTPGNYYIALVFNAATAPTLARGSGLAGNGWNAGLTASTYKYATNGTGATVLPASFTLSSNTATGFAGPWAGLG